MLCFSMHRDIAVQILRGDGGRSDAAHSTGTLLIRELKTNGGQHDAVQCISSLHVQKLRENQIKLYGSSSFLESIVDDTRGDFTHYTIDCNGIKLSAPQHC
uniref:Uncharacterized protein n=1 Tax=Zea mays TaxID=4577 RepID=A0A804LCF6_MAIZE